MLKFWWERPFAEHAPYRLGSSELCCEGAGGTEGRAYIAPHQHRHLALNGTEVLWLVDGVTWEGVVGCVFQRGCQHLMELSEHILSRTRRLTAGYGPVPMEA
jgi:hypothetical protein